MKDLKGYYVSQKGCRYILSPARGQTCRINPDIACTITTHQNEWIGNFISDDIDCVEKDNSTFGAEGIAVIRMKDGRIIKYDGKKIMEENKIKISGKMLNTDFNQHAFIYDVEGCSPSILARDYKDPKRMVESKKCLQAGMLCGEKWEKNDEFNRRVYSTEGAAPTITAICGGNQERKIIEPRVIDTYNQKDSKRIIEENNIKILGRVMPESGKEHQNQEVYDVDGNSCSLKATDHKNPPKIAEIKIIDVYNHTDITDKGVSGTLTANTQGATHCGSFAVVEPAVLKLERTEECKAKRKETHDVGMSFKEGKYLSPRQDGVTNTLTTVQKDNLLIEPVIAASRGRGENGNTEQRLEIGGPISNTLTTVQKDNYLVEPKKIVVGNLSNGHEANDVLDPEGVMKTVMENHGKPGYITEDQIPIKSATKSGYELASDGDYIDLQYPNSETRRGKVQEQMAGTLCCTDQQGTIEIEQPNFRIRKLTETECMRLMGVKDKDSERVHKNQSKSSMYHLAGDSIVTAVLMAIFGELFGVEWQSKVEELTEDLTKESRNECINNA